MMEAVWGVRGNREGKAPAVLPMTVANRRLESKHASAAVLVRGRALLAEQRFDRWS